MNINEVVTFFTEISDDARRTTAYGKRATEFRINDIGLKFTILDLGGGFYMALWDRSTCTFDDVTMVEDSGVKAIRFKNKGFTVSGVILQKMGIYQ